MKKALKLIGKLNRARSAKVPLLITAMVAVIGFSMVACGGDDNGGGNNGGGGTIAGSTITSGADVVYDSSITNPTEAKSITDFGFTVEDKGSVSPLSKFLDGSPSVTVNNNKVTISLGTPKSDYLENFNNMSESFTVNPSNAKSFSVFDFYTSDRKYNLVCMKDFYSYAGLVYVDKDVTIKGTATETEKGITYTITFNASLKKGWNYLIISDNESTNTATYTSSTTQPSGYKWTILDYGYW